MHYDAVGVPIDVLAEFAIGALVFWLAPVTMLLAVRWAAATWERR